MTRSSALNVEKQPWCGVNKGHLLTIHSEEPTRPFSKSPITLALESEWRDNCQTTN